MQTELKNDLGLPTGVIIKPTVQMSSLNDELGQVNYILTDKTGTLTQNKMLFHKLIVGDIHYNDLQQTPLPDKTYDQNLVSALKSGLRVNNKEVHSLRCLALCHKVIFDEKHQFNSSSPEEIAFVRFAQNYQFEFYDFETIGSDTFIILKEAGVSQRYKLLLTFEFTSDRKKMSVIVERNNEIFLFTKGADDVVRNSLNKSCINEMQAMSLQLDRLAQDGYRVMLLAMKKIPKDEWDVLSRDYQKAKHDVLWLDVLQKRTETGLFLIGACSIEDKLQDQVKESIEFIREAGIKVWVITGDKGETAVSVGKNAGLVTPSSKIVRFETYVYNDTYSPVPKGLSCALVYGSFLGNLLANNSNDPEGYFNFVEVLMAFESAIFCRISPCQKQQIVKIINNYNDSLVTLAIGDGANDASMIRAAHIGVGIKGAEGTHAARVSDYYFGEFKHLVPLLFVFGTECYQKNSNVVLYNFYKNFLLVFPQFWFGFLNYFSGVSIYEQLTYQFFNILYTFSPILIYGIFDKQYSRSELTSNPRSYEAGLTKLHFNSWRFVQNFIESIVVSLLVYLSALVCFDYNPRTDGNYYGLWNFGNMCYWGIIIMANLKVLLISHSYSILQYLIVLNSVFNFFLTWFWINTLSNDTYSSVLFGTLDEILSQPEFYVYCLMLLCIALIESLVLKLYNLFDCRDFKENLRSKKHDSN